MSLEAALSANTAAINELIAVLRGAKVSVPAVGETPKVDQFGHSIPTPGTPDMPVPVGKTAAETHANIAAATEEKKTRGRPKKNTEPAQAARRYFKNTGDGRAFVIEAGVERSPQPGDVEITAEEYEAAVNASAKVIAEAQVAAGAVTAEQQAAAPVLPGDAVGTRYYLRDTGLGKTVLYRLAGSDKPTEGSVEISPEQFKTLWDEQVAKQQAAAAPAPAAAAAPAEDLFGDAPAPAAPKLEPITYAELGAEFVRVMAIPGHSGTDGRVAAKAALESFGATKGQDLVAGADVDANGRSLKYAQVKARLAAELAKFTPAAAEPASLF